MSASGLRRLVAVVVLLILLGTTARGATESAIPDLYGYVTAHELVVVRGDRTLTRAPVTYSFTYGGVTTTADGRFFAILTDEGRSRNPDARRLVVVDSQQGRVRRLHCPACTSLAPAGGSRVLVATGDGYFDGILRFDLAGSGPPVRLQADAKGLGVVRLLAGVAGEVFAVDFASSDQESYYTVTSTGRWRRIATKDVLRYDAAGHVYHRGIGRAAGVRFADGSVQFAFGSGFADPTPGCVVSGYVTLFSPERRAAVETDLSALTSGGFDPRTDTLVDLDVWWQGPELHAVFAQGRCEGSRPAVGAARTGEWRFRQGQWQRVLAEQVCSVRRLPGGVRLTLARPPRSRSCDRGILYATRNGHRQRIAADVVAVAVPPDAAA